MGKGHQHWPLGVWYVHLMQIALFMTLGTMLSRISSSSQLARKYVLWYINPDI
jgi:hypothetical protein